MRKWKGGEEGKDGEEGGDGWGRSGGKEKG